MGLFAPPLLAASACFRKSGGRLTCLTCHSPHAAMERKPAAYDAATALRLGREFERLTGEKPKRPRRAATQENSRE